MTTENNSLSFNNQSFYIGIDVHQKSWKVSIRSRKLLLKSFSMNPSPVELSNYMNSHYPDGNYYSVYEAGFCGYWIHRELARYGFKNIIVSPNKVPTTGLEKINKSDKIDCAKLSRELENGSIKGIFIISQLQQEIRSLVRLRMQLVKSQTRIKNQIKSYLNFYGHKTPENYETKRWSGAFIEYLRGLPFTYEIGKTQLNVYLDELAEKRKLLAETIRQIKSYSRQHGYYEYIQLLMGTPGIGFLTASTLFFELIDINRFTRFENLASYVGLVPSVRSSADKYINMGLKHQHNKYLRNILIEAAWVAVRKDPALMACYNEYIKRMSTQEAIIKIAKKLLNRIRTVWKDKRPYVHSVVK